MSLENTIVRVQKNMQHSSYLDDVLGDNRAIIPKFITLVRNHFIALEKDEKVVATDDDIFNVTKVLDLCKMIVLEVPITDELKELLSDLCLLTFNWNQNIPNDKSIAYSIRFVRTTVDMHFTLIDLVTFTKAVVREAKKKNVTSSVQTDEISRHFLSAIDALQKEKDSDEDICS